MLKNIRNTSWFTWGTTQVQPQEMYIVSNEKQTNNNNNKATTRALQPAADHKFKKKEKKKNSLKIICHQLHMNQHTALTWGEAKRLMSTPRGVEGCGPQLVSRESYPGSIRPPSSGARQTQCDVGREDAEGAMPRWKVKGEKARGAFKAPWRESVIRDVARSSCPRDDLHTLIRKKRRNSHRGEFNASFVFTHKWGYS